MKNYLAIYMGTPAALAQWQSLPEAERKQREATGIRAWHDWVDRNKASIVEDGGPLGRTKSVSPSGISDIRNNMAAFTVVQAESHEEAAKLFEGHPHFTLFQGDSVEVMECLHIPSK
jgi:hypothetical protein